MKRIALATSEVPLPPSDQALLGALAQQNCDARPVLWSDQQQNWRDFDVVLVRSCWNYHLRIQEFLAWVGRLEQEHVVLWNPPALIRWNASKTYLAELESSGITIPDTLFVEAGTTLDLAEVCSARRWQCAVVKPLISASAHQTERRDSGPVRGPAILQHYVTAITTEGEWSLIYFGGHFSHAVLKKPRIGDFRVQIDHGGSAVLAHPSADMVAFATRVLRSLPWPALFARVDVIVDRGTLRLMELEVIEPELFLDLAPGSSQRFVSTLQQVLSGTLEPAV